MRQMFHTHTVLARRDLTPGLIRLTFGGEGLANLKTTGIGDEYLRLFFPNEETGRLHLPHIDENGSWTYPDGRDTLRYAAYTLRHVRPEAGEIDIDFVIHEGGVACQWALAARPGDSITMNNPRGLYRRPDDAAWQLLVADATGLPALCRLLEQTPRHIQSRVFVEVARPEEELALPEHPGATATWLHGSGNGVAASRLEDVVRAVPLPPTPGYLWVAGEMRAVRAVRRYVREDLGLPSDRYQLVGYWTHQGEEWEARYEALDPAILARFEAGWKSDRDPEEVRDEYEATLEKLGL